MKFLFSLFLIGNTALAYCNNFQNFNFQLNDSIIGKHVPDFIFKSLINDKGQVNRMSDLKGKPLIIDFWATWCKPCVAVLPKINEIEKNYSPRLQILSITSDKSDVVKRFLQRMEKFDSIHILMVTNGQEIQSYFGVEELPQYAWIDKNGVLKAITYYEELTTNRIEKFIQTGDVIESTIKHPKIGPQYFDSTQIRVIEMFNCFVEKLSKIKNASLLTPYIEGLGFNYLLNYRAKSPMKNRVMKVVNMPITQMYQMAYGGELFNNKKFADNRTAIETRDSATYALNPPFDSTYCYLRIIPFANERLLYKTMQQDLKKFFGLHAYVEKREMSCLALITSDSSRVITKGNKPFIDYNKYYFKCINKPVNDLVSTISTFYYGTYDEKPIVIDETGIKSNIDLEINAKISDIDSLIDELRKHGLDLVSVKRQIDILVLRDD